MNYSQRLEIEKYHPKSKIYNKIKLYKQKQRGLSPELYAGCLLLVCASMTCPTTNSEKQIENRKNMHCSIKSQTLSARERIFYMGKNLIEAP